MAFDFTDEHTMARDPGNPGKRRGVVGANAWGHHVTGPEKVDLPTGE
jgi:hypothetical protein